MRGMREKRRKRDAENGKEVERKRESLLTEVLHYRGWH